ncbi:hypothetical protein ACFT2C_27475 [Promicromonospora sp. NPDC057138]|uniref:hypothetical protein n=1 Tax=Promicromonospora sp. NPDC057138 TaxID=3346031 RepID=UPI003632A68B
MSLTRRPSSLLADHRRWSASVLTVMLLVLAVLGAQVLCGVHLNEQAAGHADEAAVQSPGLWPAAETTVAEAPDVEAALAPPDDGAHGCSDHRSLTAQGDPVRQPPPGPAVMPELAAQWLVADLAHREPPVRSSVTDAAAPSLTALGISRT